MEGTREVEIVVSLRHTFALRCFLNSLANLEYSTFPFLDGGKSDRKNERYLRRTSRYLLPPSMRRIRYRFASNIPTFPLSLRHTVVSDNHGGGRRRGNAISNSRNINRRKISSILVQFQPVSRRLFSRSDKELVSRYYSTPRSRRHGKNPEPNNKLLYTTVV